MTRADWRPNFLIGSRRDLLIGVLLALALLGVSACRGSSAPEATTGAVRWRDCSDGWQCATLPVPIDRGDPDGPTVALAVERRPAGDAAARRGVLFVNTGGPLPVLDSIRSVVGGMAPEILDAFDVVAFDPRGLGRSDPVDCGFDAHELFAGLDYSPDAEAEFDALVDANRAFAEACAASDSAPLLGHLDIATIAADLDDLRDAMGEEQISYLGFSWGTYLGLAYADQFPDRVRAMVLDGVVDPTATPRAAALAQAVGFEESLDAFLDWCTGNAGCSFHPDDPRLAFARLFDAIDSTPIDVGRVELGPAEFDLAVASLLYVGPSGYPTLARLLLAAEQGTGQELYRVFEQYIGTGPDYQGFLALSCADGTVGDDPDAVRDLAEEAFVVAPKFGPSTVYLGLTCSMWPSAGSSVLGAVAAPGAPPILVVGTVGDPATPYEQAVVVAEQLESGVLVTWTGNRHTAYGASACVDEIVDAYLLDLTVPEPGARCT